MSAIESGRLSHVDEREAKEFLANFGTPPEVPDFVMRHGDSPNLGIRHKTDLDRDEEILKRLGEISDPYDLIPEQRRQDHFDRLAESERVYRQGLDDAVDLPLG